MTQTHNKTGRSPRLESAKCALLLACFIALSIFPFAGSSKIFAADQLAGSRPNIILVMTDDQGFAQLGRHGHPWIHTPNIDELFDRSTRFTAFHVCPTCSPTRSALMTGRYPFKNGVSHTILERERMTLKATTVAQLLKKAGYHTGIFGKWHLGDEEPYQPQNRGFDETFIHGAGGIGQAYDCSCADAPGNSYFNPIIRHNGKFVQTKGFCTDVFFQQALGWIKEQQSAKEPFFAYIATNAPHGPFLAPDDYKERFLKCGFKQPQAGFYGMVENIDTNIGLLLQKLAEWKLDEKTLVIFISDNGTTGGGPGMGVIGHDQDGKEMRFYNAGMKGLKGSIDEGGTHVPAFFYWKGHLEPGREIDRLAAHIDILPTLLALAGAEVPSELHVDGRNLLPLLANPQAEWPDRNLFFHIGRWPKGSNPDDAKYIHYGVRNQQYRFTNNKELFDIQADPGQKHDIAAQHPEIVDAMRADYEKFWAEIRPLLVNEDVPLSKTRPFFLLYEAQKEGEGIPEWQRPEL